MIVVKCKHCDKIDDETKPCILLTTELVKSTAMESDDGGKAEWESVTWFNNTEELLPNWSGPETRLGLFPYPQFTTPFIIADKFGISGMWGRPLLLFFYLYDMQANVSDCVGKIYSVKVVELAT